MVKMAKNEFWRVITRGGRKAFEGTEDQARKFIADHFPRLHVEPHSEESQPDAVLVAPGGNLDTGDGVEVHHGPETGFKPMNEPDDTPETPENDNATQEGNDNGNS